MPASSMISRPRSVTSRAARRSRGGGSRSVRSSVLGAEAPALGVGGLLARALVSGPIPDPLTGPGYAYRHALLATPATTASARADRARLHARLAVWLESVAVDDPGALADRIGGHYESALRQRRHWPPRSTRTSLEVRSRQRGASWLERAAERTIALAAHDAGADLLRRAIALTIPPDGPDQPAGSSARRPRPEPPATWSRRFVWPSRPRPCSETRSGARRRERSSGRWPATASRDRLTRAPGWCRNSSASKRPGAGRSDACRDRRAAGHPLGDRGLSSCDRPHLLHRRPGRHDPDSRASPGHRSREWRRASRAGRARSTGRLDRSGCRPIFGELADLAMERGRWDVAVRARRVMGWSLAYRAGDPWPAPR